MSSAAVTPASSRSALWAWCRVSLGTDGALHAIVLAYVLGAGLLGFELGALERLVPLLYLQPWIFGLVECALIYLLVCQVVPAIGAGSRRPLTDALMTASATITVRLLPGILLTMALGVFFGSFTSVKNMLPLMAPFWLDGPLADLDAALHGGRDPWLWLHPVLGYPPVTRAIEIAYSPVWFILLIGIPGVLAFDSRMAHLRVRYILAMLLCFVLLGNVLAGFGMSAGPVYFGHVTGNHDRFAELVRYLSSSDGVASASGYQALLWEAFITGRVELGTGISAFPSIHVAMATLFALAGWHLDRRFGWALTGYWLVILVSSVHLGWHYALDGYVAALCALAIWALAGWLQRLLRIGDAPTSSEQRGRRPGYHAPAAALLSPRS